MLFVKIKQFKKDVNIGKGDWFSQNDLYIKIIYGGETRVTTVSWNNVSPVWNESFLFDNCILNNIIFEIYDSDKWSPDEMLSRAEYTIDNIDMSIKTIDINGLEIEIGDIYYNMKQKYSMLFREKTVVDMKLEKIQTILNCKTAPELGENIN
jgi:Ca2+-dependent lipid-binding protein